MEFLSSILQGDKRLINLTGLMINSKIERKGTTSKSLCQ